MISQIIKCIIAALILSILISCQEEIEIVEAPYIPKSAHDAYSYGIHQLGLANTSLGALWLQAADTAYENATEIRAPFTEEFIVEATTVTSHSYRMSIKKGQKLILQAEVVEGDSIVYFVDAFRVSQDSLDKLIHIASIDSSASFLEFEVVKAGDYLIRFQPELLKTAKIRLNIKVQPSLLFPVSGKGKSAIGSLFGVPREAGRRVHEGIDIFAKRHTPLIAVTDGIVQFAGVKEGSLGGTVVWLRDTMRRQNIYYAHLEDVFVDSADYVFEGDTIGTVGNSGNAITTFPHLHFGIYKNGALDPYPFVVDEQKPSLRMLAKVDFIGQEVRAKWDGAVMKGGLKRRHKRALVQDEYIKIVGCTGAYYKTEMSTGEIGYVFYDNIESIDKPFNKVRLSDVTVYDSCGPDNIKINYLESEKPVEYLARSNNMIYIRLDNGTLGWIKDPKV